MIETLEDAIRSFEDVVKVEHPLFEMPVVTAQPDPNASSPWMFATDHDIIQAHIYKPDEIQSRFEKVVSRLYASAYDASNTGFLSSVLGKTDDELVELLSFHNAVSLLIHELFHSLYMPNSKEDKEKIYQAISAGIKRAEPSISAQDLVTKTKNVENAVWDFAIDTFQYFFISQNKDISKALSQELAASGYELDGIVIDSFPEGVIPIFDVVSYSDKRELPSSVLSLTRYTYSLLFCSDTETRRNLLDYFRKKIRRGGITNIEPLIKDSLVGLTDKVDSGLLAKLGISRTKFHYNVDELWTNREADAYNNSELIRQMSKLLMDKRTRYSAIEGFIRPLAHLIDLDNYEQRGEKGEEQGDISEVVDSITQEMSEGETQQFLQDLAEEHNPSNPRSQALSILGRDEYYKRNAPEIPVKSTDQQACVFDSGEIKLWVRDTSVRIPVDELHKHMSWIRFGLSQNLPVLFEVVPGFYQVNYFKQEEQPLQSYDFHQRGIDVAENWILVNDSSGSMTGGAPGSGTKWDGLMHINYGMIKSLYNACTRTSQDTNLWVVNFSERTQVAGPFDLVGYHRQRKGKEKLLLPQLGETVLDTRFLEDIAAQLGNGRTVWSFTSDGHISNYDHVYSFIENISRGQGNSVLYFEMFASSALGSALATLMQQRPNVLYRSVRDMNQILQENMDVLVRYE